MGRESTESLTHAPPVVCDAGVSASLPAAQGILQRDASLVDDYLRQAVRRHWASKPEVPPALLEAVEYSLHAGGKRVRPTLVLECFSACRPDRATFPSGADVDAANPFAVVLPIAGAIELIHTFSLVHDDLPAMDDDDLRRGRPTSHKVFGEAMAILAGDAMVAMAFEIASVDSPPALVPALVCELSTATGPAGMVGGQVHDIASERTNLDLERLIALHRMKTGALLSCACRCGAIGAGASPSALEAVTRFGRHLGLAFQIVDDLLDVTSTPEKLGKRTQKDHSRGKNTYPGLLGLDGARRAAEEQVAAAGAALEPLGTRGRILRQISEFIVDRHT